MLDIDETADHNATAKRLRYLVPGLSLRISDLGDPLGGYACTVVEADGHQVWVDLPIRRDGLLELEAGQLVTVRFERPDDAAYVFDTVVAEVRADDTAPFGLAAPVTIDRRPHRVHARVPLVLDATYTVGSTSSPAKVVDLSAGGLGLICDVALAQGTELDVRFALPGPEGDEPVDHRGVVHTVAVYGDTPGGVTLHRHGIELVDADEALRERILGSLIWNLTHNAAVL